MAAVAGVAATKLVLAVTSLAFGLLDVSMSAVDMFSQPDKHETVESIGVGESLIDKDSTSGN